MDSRSSSSSGTYRKPSLPLAAVELGEVALQLAAGRVDASLELHVHEGLEEVGCVSKVGAALARKGSEVSLVPVMRNARSANSAASAEHSPKLCDAALSLCFGLV